MAAVAYTSTKAARDFYRSELEREKREMKEMPDQERKEIRVIYARKGFSGALLNSIVKKITSNKKLWLRTMMEEELHLFPDEYKNPAKDAAIVGIAAVVGSLVPLVAFLFLPVNTAIVGSILLSILVLFLTGYIKGKITIGRPIRSGIEMAVIGMAAAIVGYAIGALLGVALYAA
jgi:predicted membrane protein (TIGR00267 family)